MSKAEILITHPVPLAALEPLKRAGRACEMLESEQAMPAETLRAAVTGRSGVICQVVDRMDKAVLEAMSSDCRVLATVSVGLDHIDVATARRLGIVVTHTPDVLTETVADLTWALILATARRVGEAERIVRAGRWQGWGLMQFLGLDVHGATLGIVGGGRIGSAVARRAAGFNMRVLCCTRDRGTSRMPPGTEHVALERLLADSDFVSLHVPLTQQTRHLIGAAELRRMKPTAILVNTTRGPVVDEAALAAALRDRLIAGAGLDVYEHEPRMSPELLAMEHVTLLPHIGSASRATREAMARMATESVAAVLDGRRPANVVG